MIFNRPQLADALAKLLGLKGSLTLDLQNGVSPIVSIGDIAKSPFLQFATPVFRPGQSAAVVGEFSVVAAQVGAGVILELSQVIIRNTGAAVQDVRITLMTGTDVTTAGLAATAMVDTFNIRNRPSSSLTGSHTAILGTSLAGVTVPADSTLIVPFTKPIYLDSQHDSGRPAIGVWGDAANVEVQAAFQGAEWPLPG